MDIKSEPKTELQIMNQLFYRYTSEAGRNVLFGATTGFLVGLILKKPKIGLFLGTGIALGLTTQKYERAFQELKVTKQAPILEQSFGIQYFMNKVRDGRKNASAWLKSHAHFNKKTEENKKQ